MNLEACKTILVFGGTFDPPHVAHVALPMLAMEAVGADAVAYVPAGVSPFKVAGRTTPADDRLAMLRLAVNHTGWACVLTDEIDRTSDDGPSFTVDTLEALRQRLGLHVTLRLLIGGDQLRAFDLWREHQRIVELAEPTVMVRPPDDEAALLAALPRGFDEQAWSRRLIDLPRLDVSSTMIRQRVADGRRITGLVPPDVECYIHEHRLYTA
jgi:nicotinate-nucleotide adenylyltransferase